MKNNRIYKSILLGLLVLAGLGKGHAQLPVAASENLVNATTIGNQMNPAIGQASNGQSLIVWESENEDGNKFGIFGRSVSATGSVSGTATQVNTSTTGNQVNPDLAVNGNGNAVAVWMDDATDGDGWGVFGQRMDVNGNLLGSEITICDNHTGSQRQPSVAMDNNGNFVVVWTGESADGDGHGVVGKRFDSSGTSQGSEFVVNTHTSGYQGYATVAMDSAGNFAVAWQSYGQDGDGSGVYARTYDPNGNATSSEFQVSSDTSGNQQEPSIAMDASGQLVVSWSVFGSNGLGQVKARRFDLSGTALSTDLTVSGSSTESHDHSCVTMTREGTYAVTYSAYGRDGAFQGVYLQTFDSNDSQSYGESLINTETAGFQHLSRIAWTQNALPLALAWQSGDRSGSSTQDGDAYGIYTKQAGNIDTLAPVALCQNLTVYLDASGSASITEQMVDGGSSDDIGITNMAIDRNLFSCLDTGAQTVVLTVEDLVGNVSTCQSQVTILDTLAPTAVCQNVTLQLDGNGEASLSVSAVDNGTSDNCGFSASINQSFFSCSDVGSHTVVLTATDNSGNVSTCSATVTVQDALAPTAQCHSSATVNLGANGTGTLDIQDINNGTTDNCGLQSISISETSFDCTDLGTQQVVLTAVDDYGNSSQCTTPVLVQDLVAPTAVCKNATVNLDGNGSASISTSNVDNGSSDNCSVASLALSQSSFDCSDIGNQSVVLTVTDGSGNTSTCTSTVTVRDQSAPTLSCPANEVYSCVANIPNANAADATASDNCDASPNVTVTSNFIGCSNNQYRQLRVYTATDDENNSQSCTQIAYANVPTSASAGSCTFCIAKVTVTPNCSNPAMVSISSCQKIAKVRLVDKDGAVVTWNTSTKNGTWTHPSGKPVRKVRVLSGCSSSNFSHTFELCNGTNKGEIVGELHTDENSPIELTAYPNPTNGQLTVELSKETGFEGITTVKIVDLQGKVLKTRSIEQAGSFQQAEFDLSGYSNGMYYIIVDQGDQRLTHKVIKQ